MHLALEFIDNQLILAIQSTGQLLILVVSDVVTAVETIIQNVGTCYVAIDIANAIFSILLHGHD